MNINKNAQFVLKTPGDGISYVSVSPIRNFSFCGGNEFTISFNMFCDSNEKGVIIEQEGAFSISVENSQLVYTTVTGFNIKIPLTEGLVAKSEFNYFDITYDKKTLMVYINGVLCKEANAVGRSVYASKPMLIGRGYNGYISKFKVANYSLSQKEITKNIYTNSIDTAKLEANIIFNTSKPEDFSKNKLSCNIVGSCASVNIIRALTLRRNGIVTPEASPEVYRSFTVSAKIYLTDYLRENELIFSIGDYSSATSFCFGVKNAEKPFGFARIGGMTVEMSEPLEKSQWLDLSVTSDGRYVKIFVDGVEKTKKQLDNTAFINPGKVYIGNGMINGVVQNYGFSGYIDYISVFSTALDASTLVQMVECPPFVYSENVQAIYRFSVNNPFELISFHALHFMGASVLIVENTIPSIRIQNYSYDYDTRRRNLTDTERWGATALLNMIALFMREQHGLEPRFSIKSDGVAAYPDALLKYTAEKILNKNEAQLALSGYNNPDINKKNITSLITMLSAGGFMFILGASLSVGSAAVIYSAAKITMAMVLSEVGAVIISIGAISLIVATIIKQITNDPPQKDRDDEDEDDNDDDNNSRLALESITFNHAPGNNGANSAISIKKDSKTLISTPEWLPSTAKSQCAYVQSSLIIPEIKVSFKYTNKRAEPCTALVTGEANGLFGSFTQTVTFKAPGTQTINIPLPLNTIKTSTVGEKTVQINWTASLSTGNISFMGVSKHTVYIVPQSPISPFGTNKNNPESLLDINLLTACAKMSGEVTVSGRLKGKFIEFIRSSKSFTPSTVNNYASYSGSAVGFNTTLFCAAFNAGRTVSLNALDASVLLAVLCRANGIVCNIAEIKSTLDKIPIRRANNKIEYVLPNLFTNPVRALSDSAYTPLEGLTEHYVNTDGNSANYDTAVYDAYYTVDLGRQGKSGGNSLSFTDIDSDICGDDSNLYYREAFFATGVFVNISSVITSISNTAIISMDKKEEIIANGETELIVKIIGINNNNLTCAGGRRGFDNLTIRSVPTGNGQAICHSISYSNIERWIVEIINSRNLPNPQSSLSIRTDLERLKTAVFRGLAPAAMPASRAYNASVAQINTIFQWLQARNQTMNALAAAANNLLNSLNNALPNLRAADATWNQKTKENFDPRGWVHYNANRQIDFYDGGAGPINWPGNRNVPVPAVIRPNSFYLYKEEDCNSIRLAVEIDPNQITNTMMGIIGNIATIMNVNGSRQIIYSSNNLFTLVNVNGNQADPIFYYDSVTGNWVRF